MTNGQNVARSRHLEELARAAKRYTLQEILDVTEAIAAELGGLSSPTYEDFIGATSIAGGISGLVPAPSAGDESKFLRGDGVWAIVESGGSSYVDFTGATSIAGGLSGLVPAPEAGDEAKFLRGDGSWATVKSGGSSIAVFTGATTDNGTSGLVPAPQAGDNGKFLRGDGTWATVSSGQVEVVSGGTVLSTVPATVDGGLWCEVSGTNVILNLRFGNYAYKFTPDSSEFVGSISHPSVAAYLPFTSTTEDEKGNEWTLTGTSDIRSEGFYFDNNKWLTNQTISDSIGLQPWAVDFWATATENSGRGHFFGTNNLFAPVTENPTISVAWNWGNPIVGRDSGYPTINLGLTLNTPHHYALTYDGMTMRFFVDGVLKHTQTIQVQLSGDFSIGSGSSRGSHPFIGYMSHFRIWRGTARWIEDFTPPTSEDYL